MSVRVEFTELGSLAILVFGAHAGMKREIMPHLCQVLPQIFNFCGADFSSEIAVNLLQKLKTFLLSSQIFFFGYKLFFVMLDRATSLENIVWFEVLCLLL